MAEFDRRKFVRAGLLCFAAPLGQLPLNIRSASADGGATIAIITACIAVAQALASLSAGSNGLGQRLEAMQLALGAILQAQLDTLNAIGAVNDNLNLLKRQIPDLFKQDAYRRSFEETLKSYEGTRTLAKQISQVSSKKLNDKDFERFLAAYTETRDAATQLSANITEAISGPEGVAAIAFAACSVRMLAELCWILADLNNRFPLGAKPPSWKARIALGDLSGSLTENVLPRIRIKIIETLLAEQKNNSEKALKEIGANVWGPPVVALLSSRAVGNNALESCFRSGYSPQSIVVGQKCRPNFVNMDFPENCRDLMANYSVAALERRKFVLEIEKLPQTGDCFVKSISVDTKITGWHVPEAERSRLDGTPHDRGSVNVPAEGKETPNFSGPKLDQEVLILQDKLQVHAQAALYFSSLSSLKASISESANALDLLKTSKRIPS
jgi:hypothetical protein